MVRKLNSYRKAAAVNRPLLKFIRSAGRVSQDPRLPLPHLRLVLSILAHCSAVRRLIIVQADVKTLIHIDVALTLKLAEARNQ